MAAPAFGSIGTLFSATTATPQFAVPASVAAGDIIVIGLWVDVAATTISAFPAGFVQAENSPRSVAGNWNFHVCWKRASGADTGTYDFTLSASRFVNGNAVRYTGCVAAGNPWDSPTNAVDGGAGLTLACPDVNVTTAGPDRMLFYAGANGNGSSGTWTPPAGFSQRQGGVALTQLELSDKVQAAQGASGNTHATSDISGQCGSWLGALIGTTASGPVRGQQSTSRHPGKGPGRARFFQTPRPTNAGNVVNIDGSLVVTANTTATVAVTHVIGGSLTVTANRTATVAVTHTVGGSLTVTANRTATVAVTHTIGGSLAITANRTASIARTANIAGSLVVTASRTATVAVTHTIAGSLVVTAARTATVAVTHTISGTRVTTVNRTATVAVTHTIGGSLTVTANRTATVAVTHTISGTRVTTVNRTATVAVTHTISGALVVTVNRIASVGVNIDGTRVTTVNRTATVVVTHTVTGSRPITVGLTASMDVAGGSSSMFLPFF